MTDQEQVAALAERLLAGVERGELTASGRLWRLLDAMRRVGSLDGRLYQSFVWYTPGMSPDTKVIGYVRVSTAEQGDQGAGLEAQRQAITAECRHRGWQLVALHEDVASGKSTNGRIGLEAALGAIERGEADALIVAKLDRLSRSLLDFARLLGRSQKKGWQLVALDLGVDTATPAGEMMANVLAVFAQFERRVIGQRTRDGLAIKRAQGVRLGRPPTLPCDVVLRIQHERRAGSTLREIADRLNHDRVPTAQGGRQWWPATVRKVVAAHSTA